MVRVSVLRVSVLRVSVWLECHYGKSVSVNSVIIVRVSVL